MTTPYFKPESLQSVLNVFKSIGKSVWHILNQGKKSFFFFFVNVLRGGLGYSYFLRTEGTEVAVTFRTVWRPGLSLGARPALSRRFPLTSLSVERARSRLVRQPVAPRPGPQFFALTIESPVSVDSPPAGCGYFEIRRQALESRKIISTLIFSVGADFIGLLCLYTMSSVSADDAKGASP